MGKPKTAAQTSRWVVKIGTSLLTKKDSALDLAAIENWATQIAALRARGMEFIIVSSGAIGAGLRRLTWRARPREVHKLQAAAAVGQMRLVRAYESAFDKFNLITAQILLTHADLANRERYLNARSTLRALLRENVIPIVNENDTVANEQIRFGDNDTLAALVCNLAEADLLVILTDQPGLHDRDPRAASGAKLIKTARADDATLLKNAGAPGGEGRGGMQTKILAAQKAARAGASTVIAHGRERGVLQRLADGESLGTFLQQSGTRLAARKQWLAGQLRANGELTLDAGAVKVLRTRGKSLLPIGVVKVAGDFARGEIVVCVDENKNEVARGLINYNASDAKKIAGHRATDIGKVLGYVFAAEMIHRDNIVITAR